MASGVSVIGAVTWAIWTFWESDIGQDCLEGGGCLPVDVDLKDYFRLLLAMFGPPVLIGLLVRWVIAGFSKRPRSQAEVARNGDCDAD